LISRCVTSPSSLVRQFPASKDMKTEGEDATALEAVTRQPVRTQQTEKTLRALMDYRVCVLAAAL
jgi:hypothetical protein